jgi:hypothetical protein
MKDKAGKFILPKPQKYFLAFGVSGGFVNERLYHTASHVQSGILPISLQGSRIWQGDEAVDENKNDLGYRKAPKMIVSAQVSYTPLFSDLHNYQLYETTSFTIPTGWNNVNLSFTQTDYYLNNAPASYKRNYAAEGVVLTVTFPTAELRYSSQAIRLQFHNYATSARVRALRYDSAKLSCVHSCRSTEVDSFPQYLESD